MTDPNAVVEEVVEETTEEAQEQKSFDEMSEDEQLQLSDEELAEKLSEVEQESEETTDTPPEKEGETEEEGEAEETEELTESEYDKISKMSDEERHKLPPEIKGIYGAMKDERRKRQDIERELEHQRELNQQQINIMKQMRGGEKVEQQQFATEYDKVKAEISVRAKQYEDEYGEPYRPTWQEQQALDTAKANDAQKQHVANERNMQIRMVDDAVKASEAKFISTLGADNDYDHVYKNFAEKVLNPNTAENKAQAVALAQTLINLALTGGDVGDFVYNVVAPLSPDGKKYFANKAAKRKNDSDVNKSSKKVTETTSHLDSTKVTTGKTKVTAADLEKDFEKWNAKLTDEQFMEVADGKVLYI